VSTTAITMPLEVPHCCVELTLPTMDFGNHGPDQLPRRAEPSAFPPVSGTSPLNSITARFRFGSLQTAVSKAIRRHLIESCRNVFHARIASDTALTSLVFWESFEDALRAC